MKKTIAMILIVLMLLVTFGFAACGKEEPVETQAPAQVEQSAEPAPAETPAEETPAETPEAPEEPVDTPMPTANAEGKMLFKSDLKGFSFEYDEKYIAMPNVVGNAVVYAGDNAEIPFCSVTTMPEGNAIEYLKSLGSAAKEELGGDLVVEAKEPAQVPYGDRDIYYTHYTYYDAESAGNILCVYYAENLSEGGLVVYNSLALEGQTEAVDSILTLAIQTFKTH